MSNSKRAGRYNPSSEDFNKEDFPFYWVARLNNIYTHCMGQELKKVGADVPTWRILFILRENGTSSMSEIALHAVVKLSTITKIVYRIKEEGLVDTATSAVDGRVTEVSITERGRQMINAMQTVTANVFDKGFKGLSSAKIMRLNNVLECIFENLRNG